MCVCAIAHEVCEGLHFAVMQALVDYQYIYVHGVMDIYIRWPGSVHDAHILANSDLLAKGEEGTLLPDSRRTINGCNESVLILGDHSYPLYTSLVNEGLL